MSELQKGEIQKEKQLINKIYHEVLHDLKSSFPWTVLEIAVSLSDRLGKNNVLLTSIIDDVLSEDEKLKIDTYLPECSDNGLLPSDIIIEIQNDYSVQKLNEVFSSSFFSLNTETKEKCLPWDLAEQNSSYEEIDNEKLQAIIKIKIKLRELALLRGIIARFGNETQTEALAIDTLFEVLNFQII